MDESRRAFLRTAVALGGSVGLSMCLSRDKDKEVPKGSDRSSLPERQFAWNEYLDTDDAGNPVAPRHHLVLLMEYSGGEPGKDMRDLDLLFRSLEKAYEWSNEGLLYTVGYSRRYFDRFDAVPVGSDIREPEPLAEFENPEKDRQDIAVHLASDHGSVVLSAEEALKGNAEELNDVEVEGDASFLRVDDRRPGFVGKGLPSSHQDVEGVPEGHVPEESPLYMGFKSGFRGNQASEKRVAIGEGSYADGCVQHVSKLDLNLDQWYLQDDRFQRVGKMFCPLMAEEGDVKGVGDNLGQSDDVVEHGCPAHTEKDAEEYGMVGHSQKTARARRNDEPLILRRDFDSAMGGRSQLVFVSLQESTGDFVETRKEMNGGGVADTVGRRNNNGILQYIDVERRGNFLIPPRSRMALPT
ncbi:MAG: Tat pathway signal protein [Halobacteria archaeon]